MDVFIPMTEDGEWRDCLASSSHKPVLVFKHSFRCPISAGAYDELAAWLEDAKGGAPACRLVDVVAHRPVSEAIAQALDVRHESPQAILVAGGKAVWHASHWDITYSSLDEHLGNYCEK